MSVLLPLLYLGIQGTGVVLLAVRVDYGQIIRIGHANQTVLLTSDCPMDHFTNVLVSVPHSPISMLTKTAITALQYARTVNSQIPSIGYVIIAVSLSLCIAIDVSYSVLKAIMPILQEFVYFL
jgi:hypothetical protein